MAGTITFICLLAMIFFILAFMGALHVVMRQTVSYYFAERKKFLDSITKDEIMLKMTTNSDIKEA